LPPSLQTLTAYSTKLWDHLLQNYHDFTMFLVWINTPLWMHMSISSSFIMEAICGFQVTQVPRGKKQPFW